MSEALQFANERLRKASKRLKEANEELHAAEREQRIATERVEHLEKKDMAVDSLLEDCSLVYGGPFQSSVPSGSGGA